MNVGVCIFGVGLCMADPVICCDLLTSDLGLPHIQCMHMCVCVCTGPPSEVRNLTVTFHDQSLVNLSWTEPEYLGGRLDLQYRVSCVGCGSGVFYKPRQQGFNSTKYAPNS